MGYCTCTNTARAVVVMILESNKNYRLQMNLSIVLCSTSPPGGNLVDGLPPADMFNGCSVEIWRVVGCSLALVSCAFRGA